MGSRSRALVAFATLTFSAAHSAAGDDDAKGPGEGEQRESDTEFTIVPLVGGDSDRGFGGGYIMSLARVKPDLEPYLWRVESAGSITFKPDEGGLDIPYVDDYLMLSLPHVIRDTLSLSFRLSHTHERQLTYFGLGNAAVAERDSADPYYRYTWTHPRFETNLGYENGKFRLGTGVTFTWHSLGIPRESRLRDDAESDDSNVRRLTMLAERHAVVVFSYGAGWDGRDDEISPERGGYHTLNLELAPGAPEEVPYRWMRSTLSLRQYVPLYTDRLVFAARVVTDSLLGQPPFYELARSDNSAAIGGSKGIRGIPALRYHGTLKLLSNFELRVRLFTFRLLGKSNQLGTVAFVDAGRLWADYHRLTELDGGGLGLKLGFGAGLRLRAGKSFVLRADFASSSEGGFSGYLGPGHVF